MADPKLEAVFRLPFAEQVAFFRRKMGHLVPTQFWTELQKSAHDSAFMVAGATKADLLADLYAAVERNISGGLGLEAFRKDFEAIVARHGWTGWTGSGTAGGRAWRTRVIYTTNANTSYAAGRLAQLREGKFKLWVYRHADGEDHPRPIHESWDGLTLPPDHPFWKAHYPPDGWGCQCYVVGARDADGARRLGGDPDKELPEDWNVIDPATGEQRGIDQGWGYMPGDTVSDDVQALVEKPVHWPYEIAKAYMQDLPAATRDTFATSYRNLPSVADETRRYAQRVLNPTTTAHVQPFRTLGMATTKQVQQIAKAKRGLRIDGLDFAVDPPGIGHVQSAHGDQAVEVKRGQDAVTAADYALLPALLNDSKAVIAYAGKARGSNVHAIRINGKIDDQAFVTVWRVLTHRKMLALQSFFKGAKKP